MTGPAEPDPWKPPFGRMQPLSEEEQRALMDKITELVARHYREYRRRTRRKIRKVNEHDRMR